MKFISSFVALLCAVVVTSCTDAKALTLEEMTVSYSADSMSIRVPIKVPVGADSAVVTLTLVPGGTKTLKAIQPTTALVFTVAAAPYGQSFTAQACGRPYWGTAPGTSSCNQKQTFTRNAPSDTLTWPDPMTLSLGQWPDSASVALIRKAWSDAIGHGPLGPNLEWADWGQALLVRPAANCSGACVDGVLTDTSTWSLATRNWHEVYWQNKYFAEHGVRYRQWWDSVKACHCDVYLPIDSSAPGAKI